MGIKYQGLGWKVRLRKRRYSYLITLAKELILGNSLQENNELYYYLVNVNNRNAILLFLDGEEKPNDGVPQKHT